MNELEELQQLASALIDGTAHPAEAERLSAVLRDHPELCDAYLSYLDTHAALCWHFRDLSASTAPARPTSAPIPTDRRSTVATWFPWLVAGIAVAVALVALLRPKEMARVEPPGAPDTDSAARADTLVALLVDEVGAEFAQGRGPDGVRLGPGPYELRKGIVHLRFAQGTDVVLAGPARLEIQDSMHMRLAAGRIRVIAPPAAKGFTVATAGATYVDQGTEFGLRVEPQSNASDLYVFEGQVDVADPQSGKVLAEVFEGTSARYDRGVAVGAPRVSESDFPSPGAIGFERWQRYEQQIRGDRGLLAFFPFRRTVDETSLDNSGRDSKVPNARIQGARWTTGRWPEKDALLFDRDTDFVQMNIPGAYQELTVAAWIKLDRLDFELNAILNSDGSPAGGFHFQLDRRGLLRGGLVYPPYSEKFIGDPVEVGKWAHVALVISVPHRTQRLFVNGKLARERGLRASALIRPGSCRLGSWLPPPGWGRPGRTLRGPQRGLRGRIDELAIWSRALAQDELRRLVEAGRPRMLWGEALSVPRNRP